MFVHYRGKSSLFIVTTSTCANVDEDQPKESSTWTWDLFSIYVRIFPGPAIYGGGGGVALVLLLSLCAYEIEDINFMVGIKICLNPLLAAKLRGEKLQFG